RPGAPRRAPGRPPGLPPGALGARRARGVRRRDGAPGRGRSPPARSGQRPAARGARPLIRLWKAVLLVDLALLLGVGAGYLWWGLEARRLRQELARVQEAADRSAVASGSWVVQGIVRAVLPERGAILITHEAIGGVMPAMTMGFEVEDPASVRGL